MSKTMYAYVGCRTTKERGAKGEGISVYRVDEATGEWTFVQLVKGLVNPSFLAFDRNQEYLYTVHGDYSDASAFRIDRQTGKLTFINKESTKGTNPTHLALDPTNRFMAVANYITGSMAVLPVNPDGSLAPLSDLVEPLAGPEPGRVYTSSRQGVSHPHHCPFDTTGNFILVPDLGLDKVFVYRLDTEKGKLIANEYPFGRVPDGGGPRHVECHPSGGYVYVANELDSTVTTCLFNKKTGELTPKQTLSTLPPAYDGAAELPAGFGVSEIGVAPSGKFVYVANRGDSTIAIFAVNSANGELSLVDFQSTLGEGPRFFGLEPNGNFLYAANERSSNIVTFKADQETGKLTSTGQVIDSGTPVCIIFGQF